MRTLADDGMEVDGQRIIITDRPALEAVAQVTPLLDGPGAPRLGRQCAVRPGGSGQGPTWPGLNLPQPMPRSCSPMCCRRGHRCGAGWSKAWGERDYIASYVVLSLGLLAWLVVAPERAPYLPLWDPAPWQRWVPNLAVRRRTLFPSEGRGTSGNLERLGGGALSRQPILLALALWAGAHVVPTPQL